MTESSSRAQSEILDLKDDENFASLTSFARAHTLHAFLNLYIKLFRYVCLIWGFLLISEPQGQQKLYRFDFLQVHTCFLLFYIRLFSSMVFRSGSSRFIANRCWLQWNMQYESNVYLAVVQCFFFQF